MSTHSTVFIIGAGASTDFGFPVGKSLQTQIADLLRPHHPSETGLHSCIEYALAEARDLRMNLRDVMEQANWIADSLPLAPSIDAFLEKSSEPGDIVSFLGKLAIARIIGERESVCPLSTASRKQTDFAQLANTWIAKLWSLMNVGGLRRPQEDFLPGVSFVTFNYDRCIEQFLVLAIKQLYRVSMPEAITLASRVPCEHVYGSLGSMVPGDVAPPINNKLHDSSYKDYVSRIRTFSEQADSESSDRISELLSSATRLVFLGFSFAEINRELIYTLSKKGGMAGPRQVLGTVHGMSVPDYDWAKDWVANRFCGGVRPHLSHSKASEFFDEYSLFFD